MIVLKKEAKKQNLNNFKSLINHDQCRIIHTNKSTKHCFVAVDFHPQLSLPSAQEDIHTKNDYWSMNVRCLSNFSTPRNPISRLELTVCMSSYFPLLQKQGTPNPS